MMAADSGFRGIKGLKDCDPEHEAAILLDLAKYHDEKAGNAKDDEIRADHLSAARGCREKAAWWLQRLTKSPLP